MAQRVSRHASLQGGEGQLNPVDHHVHTQLLKDRLVLGVFYQGHRAGRPEPMLHSLADHQVCSVHPGQGHHHVCPPRAGLLQRLYVCAVPQQSNDAQSFGQKLVTVAIALYNRDFMAAGHQRPGEIVSCLAAPNDNDIHRSARALAWLTLRDAGIRHLPPAGRPEQCRGNSLPRSGPEWCTESVVGDFPHDKLPEEH